MGRKLYFVTYVIFLRYKINNILWIDVNTLRAELLLCISG
jgi:hypothetical protein